MQPNSVLYDSISRQNVSDNGQRDIRPYNSSRSICSRRSRNIFVT